MLTTRLTGLLVAGLLLLIAAAPAGAAGPATVTVRVEGAADTLVPRTSVTTTTAPVNKDGVSGHDCTGTSVAGALERATGGAWTATWSSSFKYFVTAIKGEAPAGSEFFTLWVNGKSSQLGVCDAELQQGDEVLFYVSRCDAGPPPDFACTNPPVQPLVARRAGDSHGRAALRRAGRRAGRQRSADAGRRRDRQRRRCARHDRRGRHRRRHARGAAARCARRRRAGRARRARRWRCASPTPLRPRSSTWSRRSRWPVASARSTSSSASRAAAGRGRCAAPSSAPAGVRDVRLRLTRNDRGRCQTFDGRRERFVRLVALRRDPRALVQHRRPGRLVVPAALAPRPRALRARRRGHRPRAARATATLQRGRNRVVFHVA